MNIFPPYFSLLRKLLKSVPGISDVFFPQDNNPQLHFFPFWINGLMNFAKEEFRFHNKYSQSILTVEAGWNGHKVVRTLKLFLSIRYAQISAVQLQSCAMQREMLQEHAVFQAVGSHTTLSFLTPSQVLLLAGVGWKWT